MRLVPTSKPIAELLTLSLCLMMIVAGGGRCLERRQYLLVLLLKNGSVTGYGDSVRGGLRSDLVFRQSETLPQPNAGSVNERGIEAEPESVDAGGRQGGVVAQADIVKRKIARPVCVIAHQHVVRIHRNLRVGDAVRLRNVILGAEHLGEDARRMDLGRIGRRQIAKLGLRLEGNPQKTAVQVHEDTIAIRPHRVARMIGDVALGDNAEHLAKTIDQEMIAVVLLHYRDYGLPNALQPGVFVRRKARLIAFGGVIYDARRL